MSNNLTIQSITKNVGPLFIKLSSRTITDSEIAELIRYLLILRNDNKITHDEYDIINGIISKFAKVEITEHNIKAERKNNQSAQKINFIDLIYLTNIVFKLQGKFIDYFFISKAFSGIFPDNTSFYDFITTNSYERDPHKKIGQGGFGKVFLLQFPDMKFVLKEILLPNTHSIDLVVEEIIALQRVIGSWYAVQLLAAAIIFNKSVTLGGNLGVAYILYPYIDGRTLAVYQKEQHSDEEKRAIYLDIVKAVHRLHKKTGILHSDIKPENIWIPTDSHTPPFLLDFGLVQSLDNPIARNAGTPFFWSTERYKKLITTGKSQQAMSKGINWIATVRSFTGNISNNVPKRNSNNLNLSNAFRKLYREKNEHSIRRSNIKKILKRKGTNENSTLNNSNSNSNNNENKIRRNKTHKINHKKNNNSMHPINKSTTFKALHNNS